MVDNVIERMIQLRKALNLSQEDFGKKVGLSRSAINDFENGRRQLQERHIRIILATFQDVSEHWLREGTGEMMVSHSDSIPELVRRYNFPDIVQKMLEAFETLEPEDQQVVLEYFLRWIASIRPEEQDDEIDIEAEVEADRRELLQQKKTGRLSASGTAAG